ncbi:MAG TPA: biopolymer transporter ExbD [Pirellulaceae bacterium]|nr:biopolymer transporter ExbD [Pirellulaceae bacterium]
MNRPSPYLRRDETATMESAMTPMIDVVFLLLVFFIWTASFQIVEQVLPSEMRSQLGSENQTVAEPPPPDDFQRVVIRIGWTGEAPIYRVNQTVVPSVDELRVLMANLSSIKPDSPLILHPDSSVPLGLVIGTYDEAKLAGFDQVAFAVNPPK